MSLTSAVRPYQNDPQFESNESPFLYHSHFVPPSTTGSTPITGPIEHSNPPEYYWHGINTNQAHLSIDDNMQAASNTYDTVSLQDIGAMEEKQTKERRGKKKHAQDEEPERKEKKAASKGGRRRKTPRGQSEHYLERNRQAAERCRQRKKVYEADLELQARELERNNAQLNVYFAYLQGEVLNLKTECLKHTHCDCERIRNYLMKSVEAQIAANRDFDSSESPTISPASVQSFQSGSFGSRRDSMSTEGDGYYGDV